MWVCVHVSVWVGVFVCVFVQYTYSDVATSYIPYFRDQSPRLLFISSRDFPRPLFEGGHKSRAAFIRLSGLLVT